MRILVAGATGAIGRRLVPRLVAAGHAVTGLTRSSAKVEALSGSGAAATVVDALDFAAVRAALLDARPEVVIHEMTAISNASDLAHFDRGFAATNRLTPPQELLERLPREILGRVFGEPRYEASGGAKTALSRRIARCAEVSTEGPAAPAFRIATQIGLPRCPFDITTLPVSDGRKPASPTAASPCRTGSLRQNAYPGWTASAFSDQKFSSAN